MTLSRFLDKLLGTPSQPPVAQPPTDPSRARAATAVERVAASLAEMDALVTESEVRLRARGWLREERER